MNKKKTLVLGCLLLLPLGIGQVAFGAVTVEEGAVLLTDSEGNVQVVGAGEPFPEIPQGNTAEVVIGKIKVSLQDQETISISCLGAVTSAGGGAAIAIECFQDGGKIQVSKGPVTVLQDGKEHSLNDGGEFLIKKTLLTAPATATGEVLGRSAEGGTADFPAGDSRSQEASPSQ